MYNVKSERLQLQSIIFLSFWEIITRIQIIDNGNEAYHLGESRQQVITIVLVSGVNVTLKTILMYTFHMEKCLLMIKLIILFRHMICVSVKIYIYIHKIELILYFKNILNSNLRFSVLQLWTLILILKLSFSSHGVRHHAGNKGRHELSLFLATV